MQTDIVYVFIIIVIDFSNCIHFGPRVLYWEYTIYVLYLFLDIFKCIKLFLQFKWYVSQMNCVCFCIWCQVKEKY